MVEKLTQGLDVSENRASATTYSKPDAVPSHVVHLPGVDTISLFYSEFEQAQNEYRAGHYSEVKEKINKLVYRLELSLSKEGEQIEPRPARLLYAQALTLLGNTLERLNQEADAQAAWSKATLMFEAFTSQPIFLDEAAREFSDYGIALYKIGRKDEALKVFDRLYKSETLTFEAGRYMANCLLEMGQAEEAEERVRVLVSLDPRDPFNHKSLGKVLEARGKIDEAVVEYITAASYLNSLEIPDEALRVLERALCLQPDNAVTLVSKGAILNNLGKYQEALPILTRALELSGEDAHTLFYLGQALRQLGQSERAVEVLQNAVRRDPKLVDASLELSAALFDLGHHEEALAGLNSAIALYPQSSVVLLIKGRMLAAMNRFEESFETLKQAIKIDPSLRPAYEDLIALFVKFHRYDDALALLNERQERNPLLTLLFQARKSEILRLAGRLEEALAEAELALKGDSKDPDYARALTTKGLVLRALKRNDEAVQALKQSISLEPNLNWSYEWLVDILVDLGRNEEAQQIIDQALKRSADNAYLLCVKGKLLRGEGKADEAIQVLRRALELNRELDRAYFELGRALTDVDRPEDALKAFDAAIKLNPDWAAPLTYKGNLMRSQQRYQEALVVIEQALALEPDDAWTLGIKGDVLRNLGRDEEAVEVLKRSIEIDGSLAWVHIELGKTLYTVGHYEEALAVLDQALSLERNNDDALAAKGEVLRILNRHEEALEVMNQSLTLNPDSAWTLATKGQILSELKRNEEALPLLQRAVEIEPQLFWAHAYLGVAYYALGRYQEALTELQVSLEQQFDPGWALFQAEVYCDIGNFNAAIEVLNKAIKVNSKDSQLWGLKGWALQSLGKDRVAEMLEAYQNAIELNPENLWLKAGYGDALYIDGRKDECEVVYRSVIEKARDQSVKDRGTLSLIGWCYFRVGKYPEAVQAYNEVLALNPNGISDQFDLALSLLCNGQHDLALREYQRGLDMAQSKPPLRQIGLISIALDDLRVTVKAVPELASIEEVPKIVKLLQSACDEAKKQSSPTS